MRNKGVKSSQAGRLLKKELKRMAQLEQELLICMDTYIKQYPELNEDYQRWLNISGIGQKTAIHLLVLFHIYPATNRKQINALIGLDPEGEERGQVSTFDITLSKC